MLLRKDSKHIHNIEAPLESLLVQIHPFTISPGAAWRWLPAENEKPRLYSVRRQRACTSLQTPRRQSHMLLYDALLLGSS